MGLKFGFVEGSLVMIKHYVRGFAIVALFSLPNSANAQGNDSRNIYLVCDRPSGSSTYLPGGLIEAGNAGTVPDGFSGVLSLTLSSAAVSNLVEATWIGEAGIISTGDPVEGGTIQNGYWDSEVKRFDIDWRKGNSATILVKGLADRNPVVAYTDVRVGYGLDRVSSYLARCTQFSSKVEADFEVQRALEEFREIVAAVDAAAALVDLEPTSVDKTLKTTGGGQVVSPKRKKR